MAEKINGEQNTKGLVFYFGEMPIDFVSTVSGVSLAEAPGFLKAPGGAPANVAIAVARMNGNAAFAGKLGADCNYFDSNKSQAKSNDPLVDPDWLKYHPTRGFRITGNTLIITAYT